MNTTLAESIDHLEIERSNALEGQRARREQRAVKALEARMKALTSVQKWPTSWRPAKRNPEDGVIINWNSVATPCSYDGGKKRWATHNLREAQNARGTLPPENQPLVTQLPQKTIMGIGMLRYSCAALPQQQQGRRIYGQLARR